MYSGPWILRPFVQANVSHKLHAIVKIGKTLMMRKNDLWQAGKRSKHARGGVSEAGMLRHSMGHKKRSLSATSVNKESPAEAKLFSAL